MCMLSLFKIYLFLYISGLGLLSNADIVKTFLGLGILRLKR